MIVRNPSGRPIRVEIVIDGDALALTIGPHATLDLHKYERALDALAWANRAEFDGADNDD